jgi:diguanylate cyclase (GGDEF)-like protein
VDRCARRWAAHDICAVLVRGGRTSAAARFRALFSQAAAGIGIISMSGLVVDGNDTWARQMGYPIEEMRGRALRDLFVPGTEPLALMRFRVNDGLGHDVGDRLLVRVADRLREALTAPGTLLARLGGDEFGVVVDGTHGATAAEQAQLVLEVLAAPFTIDRHELALSASVGVADSTAVGADGRELMRAADVGLYRAKARGRGRVEVHDPRGDAQRVTHHVLATEMAAALAHGELFLEYQPLVTLADDTTRRVEALPRWRHPRLGLVPPDRLVELAQETGHTGALGRWVLTDACRTAARWRAGRPGRRSASTWTSPSASSTTPTCRRRWRRSWPRPACRRSCRTWRSPRAPCSARCRVPPTPWSGWRASVSGSSSTASAPGTRTWRAWPGCRSPS